ncbi:MAG TPA: hypothetical protein VF903_07290 [Nitrospirota bacterium]
MKRFVLLVSIIACFPGQTRAAEDAVSHAMKLYEKRHYDEAASLLRPAAASLEPSRQGAANLALGMIYFKNAVLHRELYQSSALSSLDYLKKLSAARGKDRSRFVDLYLGDLLEETGKPEVASIYLEKFAGTTGVESRFREIAKAGLGLSNHRGNDASKATDLWAAINAADPEVKAELAVAYSKAGLQGKDPVGMADEALAAEKKSGKQLTMRLMKNTLSVYADAGLTEKGLDLLRRTDLKGFSYREAIGKSKVINFYDPSLLGDMATLYGRASVAYLERAASDPKVKEMAEFYLCQAYALFGKVEQSSKIASSFIAGSQMPEPYKNRIRAWQGADLYLTHHQSEALHLWDDLSRRQADDPDLLAEILSVCARLKIDCPAIVQKAAAAAETGEGKKFSGLNSAIGRYYLGRLENGKALSYLEAGRDKSNKNKIEANDPVMLVALADAYFRTKKFSEALEIYFEMSKQFPEVRQIQEAMQGVYAMEHKSAGDVKIN